MRAYSTALRRRIVEAVWRGMSKTEAACTFGVGIPLLKRYVNMAQQDESLVPRKAPSKERKLNRGATRLLEEPHRRPEVTTDRGRSSSSSCLEWVSEPTLYRAAKHLGTLPEKRSVGASERYEWLRAAKETLATGAIAYGWTCFRGRDGRQHVALFALRLLPEKDEGLTRKYRATAGRTPRN
jgi:transposase